MTNKQINIWQHFWAGVVASLTVFMLATQITYDHSTSAWVGFIGAAVAGIGKELYDLWYKKTFFDWKDAMWTIIGGLPVLIFFNLVSE